MVTKMLVALLYLVVSNAHTPECLDDGEFAPLQCDTHSNECWCVDNHGYELPKSRIPWQRGLPTPTCELMTPCRLQRYHAPNLIGAMRPQCDEEGEFKAIQCHGSTGFCWCVDPAGKEVNGTRQRGKPDCSKAVFPAESLLTACQRLAVKSQVIPGSYVPQCDGGGDFIPRQCHGSDGQCWCVDTRGVEIEGTRKPNLSDCKKVTRCQLASASPAKLTEIAVSSYERALEKAAEADLTTSVSGNYLKEDLPQTVTVSMAIALIMALVLALVAIIWLLQTLSTPQRPRRSELDFLD